MADDFSILSTPASYENLSLLFRDDPTREQRISRCLAAEARVASRLEVWEARDNGGALRGAVGLQRLGPRTFLAHGPQLRESGDLREPELPDPLPDRLPDRLPAQLPDQLLERALARAERQGSDCRVQAHPRRAELREWLSRRNWRLRVRAETRVLELGPWHAAPEFAEPLSRWSVSDPRAPELFGGTLAGSHDGQGADGYGGDGYGGDGLGRDGFGADDPRELWQCLLEDGRAVQFHPLICDGEPQGCLLLDPPLASRRWNVLYIGVLPEHRRRGVAAAGLKSAMALAVEGRGESISAWVAQSDGAARRLYDRAGFGPSVETLDVFERPPLSGYARQSVGLGY